MRRVRLGSRRPKQRRLLPARTTANADINVTPLVDVVLVLLIIFMVLTPLLEKNLRLSVPRTERIDSIALAPADQVVVKLASNGELRVNDATVSEREYVEAVRRALAKQANGESVVFILADDATNYARFVSALDGAKQAGAHVLGTSLE